MALAWGLSGRPTIRFESAVQVLAKYMLKYYRSSQRLWPALAAVQMQQVTIFRCSGTVVGLTLADVHPGDIATGGSAREGVPFGMATRCQAGTARAIAVIPYCRCGISSLKLVSATATLAA